MLGLLSMPLLVLLNAFFVAAEFALVGRAAHARRGDGQCTQKRGALAVQHAIEHLDDAIAATQLGITLASLALGWVGEPVVARCSTRCSRFLPEAWCDRDRTRLGDGRGLHR